MRGFLVLLLCLAERGLSAGAGGVPRVAPFFSADGIPAFHVECRNASPRAAPFDRFSPMKFRLDGVTPFSARACGPRK